MIMKFFFPTLVLISMLCLSACSVFKSASAEEESPRCDHKGVFQSFQHEQGCHLLLVLEDGTRLMVVGGTTQSPRPVSGMEVSVDFEPVTGMASPCVVEHTLVNLSCYQVLSSPETECADASNVLTRNWMQDAIGSFNPREVKMIQTDSLNYFQLSGEEIIIFNCKGKIDCFVQGPRANAFCTDLIQRFEEEDPIWSSEAVRDRKKD